MFLWSELEVSVTSPSVVALHSLVSEIVNCIACLLLFYKNYIVYYIHVIIVHVVCPLKRFVLIGCCMSE